MSEKVPCIGPFIFGKCKNCVDRANSNRESESPYKTLSCHPHRVEQVADETELFLGTHRVMFPEGNIVGYVNLSEEHGS